MKYFTAKEKRAWSSSRVQSMCVSYDFYTCGDKEEFEELLFFVKAFRPTIQNMVIAARNIYNHSDIETLMEKYGTDEKGIFEEIMFGLGETICTTYEATETMPPTYGIKQANAKAKNNPHTAADLQ